MEKIVANKQSSHLSHSILKRTRQEKNENAFANTYNQGFTGIETKAGVSLVNIPVHPALRTTPQVQCCAKDGAGCSCPKCQATAEATKDRDGLADISATEQAAPEQSTTEQTEEISPATGLTEPEQSEIENEPQQTIAGMIVDDSATELSDGQMRKTAFLQNLRSAICNTIGPVLATVGQTTDGCPYLNYWLDLYQDKDAEHIERTACKYAPDVAGAATAEAYITIISQRALRAAEIWVRTGRLSGIPDGVPTTLPGESPAPVQAKAKNGGVKRADDPQVISQQLGEGQPLSPGVRSRMEAAFGTSFSNVRTHTDSTASGLSSQVNARAFTVGNHIAFGSREYQPETLLGDALIAHELAHTIQQKGVEDSVDKMETGAVGYDALERDADRVAVGIVGALWGNKENGLNGIKQQSIPLLRSGLKLQRCGASQSSVNRTPTPANTPDTCPTSVELESIMDMTPGGLARGYNTAYGIVSVMRLLPDNVDWSNAQVFEDVSLKSSTCPDVWTNMCTPTDRPFPINQGTYSTVLGTLPALRNRFYDFHTSRWNRSRLHDSGQTPNGIDECVVACNQSYRCDNRALGRFEITRTFKKDTYNGRDVTKVTVEKRAVT
ncbi:MAG: DUF4157 domain-containing protein [Chitinophagaceae bacterium]|nr:DUF4157 domain-containing protein [Chitinophagaceae bacterium]MCW5926539.1 DUF4157 domain-containing protein [Chitinophagaceae bacterium]